MNLFLRLKPSVDHWMNIPATTGQNIWSRSLLRLSKALASMVAPSPVCQLSRSSMKGSGHVAHHVNKFAACTLS